MVALAKTNDARRGTGRLGSERMTKRGLSGSSGLERMCFSMDAVMLLALSTILANPFFQLGLYTDESPGLKVDPVVVLVLSLGFIFSVVALHSMFHFPHAFPLISYSHSLCTPTS